MRDFYMTLPSNSSMDYYPNNKISSFTVQLPRYMSLEGDWEVALIEIQYPYAFINVSEGNNELEVVTKELTHEWIDAVRNKKPVPKKLNHITTARKIKSGFYAGIKNIIDAINATIGGICTTKDYFRYDGRSHCVYTGDNKNLAAGDKVIVSCKVKGQLALQMGLENEHILPGAYAAGVVNMTIGIPDKMLFYCDILEPQLFGDKWCKVLRSINTTPEGELYFGKGSTVCFNPPQYMAVQLKNFESVSIDIRDGQGQLVPFQSGTSSVKLHFKEK